MSTMKHTPEPWVYVDNNEPNLMMGTIEVDQGKVKFIASIYTTKHSAHGNETARANAARIVACVNACAGMESPEDDIKRYKKALSSCLYYLQKIANMPEDYQDDIKALADRGVLELERTLPDIFPDL